MTKLLQRALENVSKLSEQEQNAAAEALFAHIAGETREQVKEVRRIRKNIRTGKAKLVSAGQMSKFWKKRGV